MEDDEHAYASAAGVGARVWGPGPGPDLCLHMHMRRARTSVQTVDRFNENGARHYRSTVARARAMARRIFNKHTGYAYLAKPDQHICTYTAKPIYPARLGGTYLEGSTCGGKRPAADWSFRS